METIANKAAITGIGETAYTCGTDKSILALQLQASLAAIADAGLAPTPPMIKIAPTMRPRVVRSRTRSIDCTSQKARGGGGFGRPPAHLLS